MGMVVIQPYISVSKLKKIKTKFLRCTGFLNSIKLTVRTNAYKLQPSLSERVIVDGHGCHTALHFGVKA